MKVLEPGEGLQRGPTSSPKREMSHWVRDGSCGLTRLRPTLILVLPELLSRRANLLTYARLGVGALRSKTLEDEVPDQVGRCERCAAGIEGFKDLLGVFVSSQVDGDQLQSVEKGRNGAPMSARMEKSSEAASPSHSDTARVK